MIEIKYIEMSQDIGSVVQNSGASLSLGGLAAITALSLYSNTLNQGNMKNETLISEIFKGQINAKDGSELRGWVLWMDIGSKHIANIISHNVGIKSVKISEDRILENVSLINEATEMHNGIFEEIKNKNVGLKTMREYKNSKLHHRMTEYRTIDVNTIGKYSNIQLLQAYEEINRKTKQHVSDAGGTEWDIDIIEKLGELVQKDTTKNATEKADRLHTRIKENLEKLGIQDIQIFISIGEDQVMFKLKDFVDLTAICYSIKTGLKTIETLENGSIVVYGYDRQTGYTTMETMINKNKGKAAIEKLQSEFLNSQWIHHWEINGVLLTLANKLTILILPAIIAFTTGVGTLISLIMTKKLLNDSLGSKLSDILSVSPFIEHAVMRGMGRARDDWAVIIYVSKNKQLKIWNTITILSTIITIGGVIGRSMIPQQIQITPITSTIIICIVTTLIIVITLSNEKIFVAIPTVMCSIISTIIWLLNIWIGFHHLIAYITTDILIILTWLLLEFQDFRNQVHMAQANLLLIAGINSIMEYSLTS